MSSSGTSALNGKFGVQILNSMSSVVVLGRFFVNHGWRVVELTACAGGCTVLTIPEDIRKEYIKIAAPLRV